MGVATPIGIERRLNVYRLTCLSKYLAEDILPVFHVPRTGMIEVVQQFLAFVKLLVQILVNRLK